MNGSGRSPRSLKLEYFKKNGYEFVPSYGPLPVSVPGCVDGWFEMHDMFGRLPMKDILQPAINYARDGFPVTEVIAYYLKKGTEILKEYPNIKEVYMPKGKTPSKGEIFKNPLLANTLEKIVKGGRYEFYKGSIARDIAAFMKKQGGFLTYDDMYRHHSEWVEPVSTTYRGYEVWELPPNGQGIAALQMLNILEGYDIAAMGFGSADYIHVFTEAKKLAFEDRAKYYADPFSIKHLFYNFFQRNMLLKDVSLSTGKKQQRFTIRAKLKPEIQFILLLQINMAIWFHLSRAITGEWDQVCVLPDWVLFCRTGGKCSVSKKVITMYMLLVKGHFIQ